MCFMPAEAKVIYIFLVFLSNLLSLMYAETAELVVLIPDKNAIGLYYTDYSKALSIWAVTTAVLSFILVKSS